MPRRVIFISGAGISVESGIRAFRVDTDSGQAMWDEYSLDEVCEIQAFERGYWNYQGESDPAGYDKDGVDLYTKTHQFYDKRRQELETVEPNLAHMRIAEWAFHYPGQVLNITTNVDDLFERAGIDRSDIVHVHGYLPEVKTDRSGTLLDVGYSPSNFEQYDYCKPNVVFFGEVSGYYKDMYNILDTLTAQDMVVVVGCSNQVINFNWEIFPAMNWGVKMAVVNPRINYLEEQEYAQRGVVVYRAGAVETFSNINFISMIERHLNGA
ncbi:tail assembly protein [Pectobacterium phage DU_PP_V]|uniref:Tail assembly protein n=1 Tax=Pectobacterium phage DU_PP_V TaxID=2041492 RepID=A0A2D2W770_9CAUD|nr:Sir2 (NAD-dependent deacetylase) [Pectobacterium phage DU_PP_V]ATS94064.1 tail assembly protein [Pectobacterium phage DU_PP_V]